jgi:flavin reductase (DIM6/NTAB) family NADH-FMN oxidoreductase RutF
VSETRRVAIVGAGPAGTALSLGLLSHGIAVTLVSDRTAEEVRSGGVTSSQITFESALRIEAALGIDALLPASPALEHMTFTASRRDGSTAAFTAPFGTPAHSIDQRLRLPLLMDEIEKQGGKLVVRAATVDDLDDLARTHDLVVVSTGRGGLASLFEPNREWSPFTRPQRHASLSYLAGVEPDPAGPGLRYYRAEGVGECFTCPAISAAGPCDIYVVGAVPGGPLDDWAEVSSAEEHVARLRTQLAGYFPEEAGRLGADVRLADEGARLTGGLTPCVRHPVGVLPSGVPVLGMADVVVLNDPVTSQGANNALKSAAFYLEAITAHTESYDAAWMRRTFDQFWRGWARWATQWNNAWLGPTLPHQRSVLDAAATHAAVAAQIVAGFDDAKTFDPWWYEADAARTFLAAHRDSPRFDLTALRRALGQYATGVTVVTTLDAAGTPRAMTANSFTSVSLNPPLVLWAASTASSSLPAFEAADRFAVNVLAADQHHLSRQFSTTGVDKFEGVPVERSAPPGAPPFIAGAVARFCCRKTHRVEAGDHVVFFGEVESFDVVGGEPLVFHSGFYRVATKHPDL